MTLPNKNLDVLSSFAVKPGGEGGTPGRQEDFEEIEAVGVEVEEVSKPGGEGGTPGV
jgi:hypothetical protein